MAFYGGKLRTLALIWIGIIIYPYPVCFPCIVANTYSDFISRTKEKTYEDVSQCWTIPVPKDYYVTVQIEDLLFHGSCSGAFLQVSEAVTNEKKEFCSTGYSPVTFRALNTLTVAYAHYGSSDWYRRSSFKLKFSKESIMCTRADHFRCSNSHQCIPKNQVCDRRDDCDDASDENNCDRGIVSAKGANTIQITALKWLMERSVSYGWEKDTHRAVTALYLSEADDGSERNAIIKQLKKELEIRQLEVTTLVALLRNSSEPISISELSMFVNALLVTCHNPRQFHGYDLVSILYDRASIAKMPCPGAYLTLCNSDWMLSPYDVTYLLELLEKKSNLPFIMDIQAMTVMALSCIKNKYEEHEYFFNDSSIYNETVEKFIQSQHSDGSFGNVYTTALITQALISSGQEPNKQWNISATVNYFKNYFNTNTIDFLSVYLVLPLLSSRSLVDIGNMKCLDSYRKQETDISDVKERLDEKMSVQYSLFIGDDKEIIHTIYLKIPRNSSAYDLMRVAQAADLKYKFLYRFVSGRMYVYQIAGITNDPEAGKFWLLHTKDEEYKIIKSHTKSPDELFLNDGEHLVMWYKTALI